MRPFEQSLLTLQKSRTMRDQRGGLGFGMKRRAGSQNQPFTDLNIRQRVPLVGAQRVDETFAERSDKPQINRRQAERTAAARDMQGKNKPYAGGFDDSPEAVSAGFIDEEEASDDVRLRQELEQMMGLPRPTTIGDYMSLKSQPSTPIDAAWSILKVLWD
jgi:hypothetical protein